MPSVFRNGTDRISHLIGCGEGEDLRTAGGFHFGKTGRLIMLFVS